MSRARSIRFLGLTLLGAGLIGVSLGDALRPGSIADADDGAQFAKLGTWAS